MVGAGVPFICICSRHFRNLCNLHGTAVLELLLSRNYLLICRSTAFEWKQLIGLDLNWGS